jgi:hypothetical protein
MSEKNINIKKEINSKTNIDISSLVERKIDFFKDIIQKTILHVQKNKILDILGISDVNNCIDKSNELSNKILEIQEIKNPNHDCIINNLQIINNELSSLLKKYGTESLEDLLSICFGSNNKIITEEKDYDKFELLKKYFHPTSYKVINKKEEFKQKKNDDLFDDLNNNLMCCDISNDYKQFHLKVYGIKLYIHNIHLKNLIIKFQLMILYYYLK